MDQARRVAKSTMWRVLGLQLCLTVVLGPTPAVGSAVPDTLVGRQGAAQQQQMAPLVVPEWWWLSSLLSLPHGHRGHAVASSTARKATDTEESPLSEGDAATLSLVLPLDELPFGKDPLPVAAAAERVEKRGSLCRGAGGGACRRGAVSTIPASEVRQNWDADYLSIPEGLVTFSQQQADKNVCKDLSVQLFRVDLREHNLEPLWVRETVHLGVCPSMLQERHLGEDVWPPSVVEVKCLCQRESCSNLGGDFRCQAVRRPVRTWVRHSNQKFMPSQESVSVGCVCVQRTGAEAKHAVLEG